MTITTILILLAAAIVLRVCMVWGKRRELLLAASVLALFWLQPAISIRGIHYWFPVFTLGLVILSWINLSSSEQKREKGNILVIVSLLIASLAMAATRYIGLSEYLMAGMPPTILNVLPGLLFLGLLLFLGNRYSKENGKGISLTFGFILFLFLILKIPQLSLWASQGLRLLNHQNAGMAGAYDLNWLGFSYIAFRLLHTIRDRQTGRLQPVSLMDYLIYVIFFPALPAGPIERIERFSSELSDQLALGADDFLMAGQRLAAGLFKKFVLADSLSLIALTDERIFQIQGSGWMWLSLIAYSFMIYFDFSGYTDIAIGLARILGINLPENFKRPYLQQNLSHFWNNWHITLTQWFRGYFFNPLTRKLRRDAKQLPAWLMILMPQVFTMLLIGLWHGVTWNFALWGLWHGVGSFVQNRWSDWSRRHAYFQFRGVAVINVCLTFLFVSLGWVFFLSHDVASIQQAFFVLLRGN
ncbi:MAG: MBOAT family protein [Anaerolineaceae bacterium]|nr:MBOAT family protein [Anaerolineaceae bacterium]